MRMGWHIALVLVLALAACASEKSGERAVGVVDGVPFYEMRAERLPDLPKPRGGHHTMLLGGELTVLGGVTDGFVLERSIAFFKNGSWQEVPMKYAHYYGFTTLLPNGKVMLGGGCSEDFGIGQSWGVEVYDPKAHECKALGIMDRKRAGVSAAVLPDGRVVVSGNWYAADAIEVYEPEQGFSFVRESAVQRTYPVIMPSASDNALILSGLDIFGEALDGTVDRLSGGSLHVPLLDEWKVAPAINPTSDDDMRIGEYTYLIVGERRTDGQAGILQVCGEQFSLLEMEAPIPMRGLDGAPICWTHDVQVDRGSRIAWMQGFDLRGHFYAARIDFGAALDGGKAGISVFRSGKDFELAFYNPARLLPGGRLALIGGVATNVGDDGPPVADNFSETAEAWIFHTEGGRAAGFPWRVILPAALLLLLGAGGWWLRRRSTAPAADADAASLAGNAGSDADETAPEELPLQEVPKTEDLRGRIAALVEGEEWFRRKGLKINDVARALGTNTTYVSSCLNAEGTSFSDYLSRCRVRYAQQQLLSHPDWKMANIYEDSGFSSSASFYRTFKAVTGFTPTEWLDSHR